ncbi:MAG: CDGSH iron-sulfur domain-containing protein [Myxococcota bacterium]
MGTKTYSGDGIDITFDSTRCIHAAECVRGLPAVFDPKARPWICPDAASADAIASVVSRCPTGALTYAHHDGPEEPHDPQNRVRVRADGPLWVRGRIAIDGGASDERRVALCRCGHSANKPFCDNAHRDAGFQHDGRGEVRTVEATGDAALSVKPLADGPLFLSGDFEVVGADGTVLFSGTKCALCRCGQSATKPFCDGSHRAAGFKG